MIEQLPGEDGWRGQGGEAVRPTWHDAARDAIRHRLRSPARRRPQRWLEKARLLLKKGRT